MKRNYWIALGVVVLIVVVWTPMANKNEQKSLTGNEQIKIGVLLPLTGESGVSGEKMLEGIKLAKKEFPSNISLVVEDTHSKVADAVSGAHKLIDIDRKSTRLNSSHSDRSRMPSSA